MQHDGHPVLHTSRLAWTIYKPRHGTSKAVILGINIKCPFLVWQFYSWCWEICMESTPMGWEIIERWRYIYNFFFNCSQMTWVCIWKAGTDNSNALCLFMHYGWIFDYSLIIMFTLLPWRLHYLHVMIQGTSYMVFHVDNFTVLISWLSFQIPRIILHMGSATFIGWAHTQNNPGYTSTK